MVDFINKFQIEELKIYETDHWVWSLRPHQATLGAGILSLKRECANFSDLEKQEFTDLGKVIQIIEGTMKSTFNYDVMNYLMLMMLDKQVHYHVIPRYKNEIDFYNEKWDDLAWPGIPSLNGEVLDRKSLHKICVHIRTKIKLEIEEK